MSIDESATAHLDDSPDAETAVTGATACSKGMLLQAPIQLPISGRQLSNRLVKAATTEGLADPNQGRPNERHVRLYKQWNNKNGSCGMVITGNVMVDQRYREAPRNVLIPNHSIKDQKEDDLLSSWKFWAATIQQQGVLGIVQLNHPGRQSPLACTGLWGPPPVAPSSSLAARVRLPGGLLGWTLGRLLLRTPRGLTQPELKEIIDLFVTSAQFVERAGFSGVQVHAAHGYLLSQFLSPRINQRNDEYGGENTKNRQRLLLEIIQAIRQATSPSFVVGVKLNSCEHNNNNKENKNEEHDNMELIQELCAPKYGLDFIEISGGSFEQALQVQHVDEDVPPEQEGFFLPFSQQLQAFRCNKNTSTVANKAPSSGPRGGPVILLTGGFRTQRGMEHALQSGAADLIGLARPLILQPNLAQELLSTAAQGDDSSIRTTSIRLSIGICDDVLSPALNSLWYQQQMEGMANGKPPDPRQGYFWTLTGMFGRSYIWDPKWRRSNHSISLVGWLWMGTIVAVAYWWNSHVFAPLPSLEKWLSTPWLCWGVGPLMFVNCGFFITAVLLEIAICQGLSLGSFQRTVPRQDALSNEPSRAEQLRNSLWTMAGPVSVINAALLSVIMQFLVPGPYPLLPLSWSESLLKLLAMFMINDFFLYWGHRIQHEIPFLWKFHAVHHRIRTPRPFTTADIHSIDATLQGGLPIILTSAICQPHPWILYLFLFFRTSENVLNHCGSDAWWIGMLKSTWLPFRAGVERHDRHHWTCNHPGRANNYGESFILWDLLFGTLAAKKSHTS